MFNKKKPRRAKEKIKEPKNKKQDKNKKEPKEKKKRIPTKVKMVFIVLFALFVLVCGVWIGVSMHQWKVLAQDMLANENSTVVDTNGDTIAEIGSEKKKEKVALSDLPEELKNAYIAIEDERYEKHHGVDAKRTLSAIASYILHVGSSSFGGSTITQQLVKNMTGDDSGSITRKVREWSKAYYLESFATKDEILETYLNVIYVGANSYGVQMAAHYYFDKDVQDLDLVECAFLAAINHAPNTYNPFEGRNNEEKIKKRTKTVLAKMKELKYIDEGSYNEAVGKVEQGISFKNGEVIAKSDGVYSYHTDALTSEVIGDVAKKKHISMTFANNYVSMSGLKITSTQNTQIQKQLEKEFEKDKYVLPSKTGKESSQAAMVIIDHKTGYVIGCTGGLGKKTDARGLNRATQSIRQTGSASKPLSVLVPAIQKRMITPATKYDDSPTTFEGGYSPGDYDGYKGNITVRKAVESSQNIPFVKIMEELKPKTAMKYMEKMGITTLTEEDNNLTLALGGLQKGISPLEMASAYATIANDGIYTEPTFYTNITNAKGSLVLESKQKTKKVCSKATAYVVKELLIQPVIGSIGTATYCAIPNMDVAAKTGTTDENYDRWLCGFTPYYTAVTWYGYDYNESIDFGGKNPAGYLWAATMSSIHHGLSEKRFEMPSGVVTSTICSSSGGVANSGCKDTYTEYFLRWTLPKECTEHAPSAGDKTKKTETTPTNTTKKNTTVVENKETQTNKTTQKKTTNTVTKNTTPSKDTNKNTNKDNTTTTDKKNTVTNSNTNKNTATSTNKDATSKNTVD